jgi:general secretion pathway protein G
MGKKSVRSCQVGGFTLIELMIVVSIIAILASIAIPKFASLIRKAKEGSTKGSLGALRSAMSIYYSDNEGQFPQTLAAFTVNAKYMNLIPLLRLPDYHSDTNSVFPIDLGPAGYDPVATSVNITDNPPQQPEWAVAFNDYGPGANLYVTTLWGSIWIPCAHTDSKGTVWTTY